MFDARQEVQKIEEDSLPGFIFRVPGVVLKTKGSEVVFKLMMSKGEEGEEEQIDLLKVISPDEKREEELKFAKKMNSMRMMRNQIRLGLLRTLRYSK